MSQGIAARTAGLMASTWSRIETGKNYPRPCTLQAIASALDVLIEEILNVSAMATVPLAMRPGALTNEDCEIIVGHWSGDWP